MGKIFAIISGKGGTGKSTVSVGLSAALSALGQRVLLIDLDEGLRCLDALLGIEENIVFDLGDLLAGKEIGDAVYGVPKLAGVDLIPAPSGRGSINADRLSKLLSNVVDSYDVVLLDFPAGIDVSLISALSRQVCFITVCNPDPVSVKDAAAVCDALEEVKASVRLVLNRFSMEAVRKSFGTNIDSIIDRSGIRLIGIVPQSEELALMGVRHKISRRKGAAKAFSRIAQRLLGRDVKLPAPKRI